MQTKIIIAICLAQTLTAEIHVFDMEKNPGLLKMKIGETAVQNARESRILHLLVNPSKASKKHCVQRKLEYVPL